MHCTKSQKEVWLVRLQHSLHEQWELSRCGCGWSGWVGSGSGGGGGGGGPPGGGGGGGGEQLIQVLR